MIYLDNSATTKPNAACVQAMTRLLCDTWGNPSSVHELGIAAERELKNARKEVAASLGAEPDRVFLPPAARRRITGQFSRPASA